MKKITPKTLLGMLAISILVSISPTKAQASEPKIIRNPHVDTFIDHRAIGTRTWVEKATPGLIKSYTSSDESVANIEMELNEEGWEVYYLVTKNYGITHLASSYNNPSYENECTKVYVVDRFRPTKKNFDLKVGQSTKTTVVAWSKKTPLTLLSENPKVATAKLLTPSTEKSYERQISIKAKSEGTTNIILRSKDGKYDTLLKVTVTKDGNFTTVQESTGVRRALVIGQKYCCYNQLPSCPKDANAMEQMCKNGGYTSVTNLYNVSKSDIKKGIQKAFKGATKDDVSLFYFSGHGDIGGKICAFNQKNDCSLETISPKELASWLSMVPGKVIVILDSCYSGGAINKGPDKTANAANQCIINAFANQERTSKGGALCGKKYQVLASSTKEQYSWCDENYGYFTHTLVTGCGYGYKTGKLGKKAPADVNKDQKLTLQECYDYTTQFAHPIAQTAVCYPEKSGFKLFERP